MVLCWTRARRERVVLAAACRRAWGCWVWVLLERVVGEGSRKEGLVVVLVVEGVYQRVWA